ncbi:MAG TPA: PadR family transcriptional regulator [Intrasporangiaceae bacterium]|nr:PadR family transcriptional regulator [Intrasporangiaceae bacterium]
MTITSPDVERKTPGTKLNATAASLLGLLAIEDWPRPWTSYELAKQAGRSLSWFWPRAQRQLLAVPPKLVGLGLAEAHPHTRGRRKGTRYAITEAGRAALLEWLGEGSGSAGLTFEAEDVIRVFFGDLGSAGELRDTLERLLHQAISDQAELATVAAAVDARAVPERRSVNALSIRLVSDLQSAVQEWAEWALAETEDWVDPREPWPGAEQAFAEVIGRGAPIEVADSRRP